MGDPLNIGTISGSTHGPLKYSVCTPSGEVWYTIESHFPDTGIPDIEAMRTALGHTKTHMSPMCGTKLERKHYVNAR
jgi:hypothetical protein